MNKINLSLVIFIVLIFFTCKTQEVKEEPVQEEVHGFRYEVPQFMEECPDAAYTYRYDNFIIEKGKKYSESNILIAIRHSVNYDSFSLSRFVEIDQGHLNTEINVNYDNIKWTPSGFEEKNIDHIAYQFYYKYGDELIFQRSVYLESDNIFYVVSLSSKEKSNILHDSNDHFWNSIRID